MRLVLALAAHFKPGSSRTVSQGRDSRAPVQSHQPHCAAAVAQGAAAALADVCHDVSRSGRDVFRYRQRNSSMDEEIENPYWSVRALVQQYEGQQRSPSESSCSRYDGLIFFTLCSSGRKLIAGHSQGSWLQAAIQQAVKHWSPFLFPLLVWF